MSALPQPNPDNHEGGKPPFWKMLFGAGQPPQSERVERLVGPDTAGAASVPLRDVMVYYPSLEDVTGRINPAQNCRFAVIGFFTKSRFIEGKSSLCGHTYLLGYDVAGRMWGGFWRE